MRNNIYNKVAAESKAIAFTFHLLLFTLITSCSQEAVIAPQVTPDALAMMNPDTPVGISAEMKTPNTTTRGNGQSVELTASTQGTYTLTFPGGTSTTAITKENITVDGVNSTNFPLYLKDFNLTEGNNRCVTRWALLEGDNVADYVLGWARLTAGDNGEPTLAFGELKHANAKITLVLKDDNNNSITLDDGVSASYILQGTSTQAVETASGEELTQYLQCIQSLANDPKDDNVFSLNVYADETVDNSGSFSADGVAIVRPTPTGGNLVETDILTITVADSYSGLTGTQAGGTYKLKLSDVKLSETENLTALKSGEHYILTVTLKHNTLVSATATVAGWNEVSADATLQGNDPSRMPPYEYDEDTNTYTIWQEEGIMSCLKDKEANNRTDATVMYKGMAIDATFAELAVVSGVETDLEAVKAAIDGKTTVLVTGTELKEYGGSKAKTLLGEAIRLVATDKNSTNAGTITLLMPEIKDLPEFAFSYCYGLSRVSAPFVTDINKYAFSFCSFLKDVSLISVTSIKCGAFMSCFSLTSAFFPSATLIDESAFSNCRGLKEISFPMVPSIGVQAFFHCYALTSVDFPSTTSIGESVFYCCNSLQSASFPKVNTIGEEAFWGCEKLEFLSFGSVINNIGKIAFEYVGSEVKEGDVVLGCALTLAEGQKLSAVYPVKEGDKVWAGYTWKSITIK